MKFSNSIKFMSTLLPLDLDLLDFLVRDLTTYYPSEILETVVLSRPKDNLF